MSKMLLSINPEYVDEILRGTKRYEYRKTRCRDDVDRIIIYATSPMQEVVGEAKIAEIVEDSPLIVWRLTKTHGGVDYNFFRSYFKGKKKAVAYKLENVIEYSPHKSLTDYGLVSAPQSYCYVAE